MASNVPVVKQIAWISILPQMVVLGLILTVCYLAGFTNPVFPAFGGYLLLGYVLRAVVASDQRKGMQLVKKHDYAGAIPFFESSYKFFTNNPWVDKYRYVTLLNSSAMDYREMALCNIAFCYSQIGDGLKARAYYKQVLKVYPNNGLAQTALRMMESVEKAVE
ncbi:tetratricopeptide repeat protein [Hymenobacter sp. 5317J-9]|uniref:tetratricopeptide repeat protein n=1 Tax=Hymenobacter sp. 5317J-9 TaxID=2932250 RepID=UPI001FD7244F|nr:tetratricopeptide repeat protein [Hymenobacter sp. 5317J-9]UOQ96321.1 tetratricopeptide repeat protein [Hymenobacter sp. 5317J-9]